MRVIHKGSDVWVETHTPGVFRTYATPIEALICESKLHLGIKTRGLVDARCRAELRIDSATISKIRLGQLGMPNGWLLRFHVWSGLSLSAIEALANMQSDVQPHLKRK